LQNANCKMQIENLHFAICILQFAFSEHRGPAGLRRLNYEWPERKE
jgi:hypothetical protein